MYTHERGALYQRKTKKPPTLESTPARRAVRAATCSLARGNALSRDVSGPSREFVDFRATLLYPRANSNAAARRKFSFWPCVRAVTYLLQTFFDLSRVAWATE